MYTAFLRSAVVCTVALLASPVIAMTDDEKVVVRTELQVAMQRSLDRALIDGAIMHVNLETGALTRMYPTAAHPMIMQGDGFYVLCADLTNDAGETVDVDFYLMAGGRGYKVFRTEIDNRQILDNLTSSGEITQF